MKIAPLAGACAFAIMASAAQAAPTITFDATSAGTTTAATQSVTSGGLTAAFTGGTYTGTVAAMNTANGNVALTSRTVHRSSTGLGVAQDGEANQVDSNGANELLQVTFSLPGLYSIKSVTLGRVDGDDTFALFGGVGGTYTRLGFTGSIASGPTGGIPVTRTNLGGGNFRLDFDYATGFDSFRFGTNNEESDGFSLRSLSVAAVPEPGTWALLILGFGTVGGALRRQTRASARGKATLGFA